MVHAKGLCRELKGKCRSIRNGIGEEKRAGPKRSEREEEAASEKEFGHK